MLAAAAATCALALAAAGAADASQLSVTGSCFVGGGPIPVVGAGFTPGSAVTISGDAAGSATADATGAFAASVTAPRNAGVAPRTFTIAAQDAQNPANASPAVRFPVVRELLWGNYRTALGGRPTGRTTWRFAGFVRNRAIYGHFVLGGRAMADHRFGVARGPCGTLVVRARRVPAAVVRAGSWTLQLDQARTYRPATEPRRTVTFRVFRTFGP